MSFGEKKMILKAVFSCFGVSDPSSSDYFRHVVKMSDLDAIIA